VTAVKDWNSRNIPMMYVELHAEARAYEAQLAQQRAGFAQEHGAKLARRAERSKHRNWRQRLVRFRTLFLVVLAVGLAVSAVHAQGADPPAGIGGKLVVTGVIGRQAGVLRMTLTSVSPAQLAPRTVVPGMPLDEAFKELSGNGWVTVEADARAGFWSSHTEMTYVLKRGVAR
jgi:hypothetical protein